LAWERRAELVNAHFYSLRVGKKPENWPEEEEEEGVVYLFSASLKRSAFFGISHVETVSLSLLCVLFGTF